MRTGTTAVVHRPDTVIVDNLYLDFLGVRRVGDEAELVLEPTALLGLRVATGGDSQ
jgi:hypothetical protein